MIRDNIENVRTIVGTSYEMVQQGGTTEYTAGYRAGILALAETLLWPEADKSEQRERIQRLYAAHRALFVDIPS